MDKRPATIRNANVAKACADALARWRRSLRFPSALAVLLLPARGPTLRAQSGPPLPTCINGGNHTGLRRKMAGAITFGLLLLAALGGAVPLAGQINPSSADVPGDWTWMSGSDTLGSSGQGVSGVYGTLGTPNGAANFPGGRWGALSWIDSSGNLWLFGGYGYGAATTFGYLNDLWEFNPSNNEWTWMGGGNGTILANYCGESPTFGPLGSFGTGYVPGGRQSASSWIDKSGNLWLFGGLGDGAGTSSGACGGAYSFGRLNDLWEFNPSNNEWAWMGGSSTVPSSGGQPGVYGTFGVFGPLNVPGARQNASSWTDSSGNFWLFGGEGYDAGGNFGELNDLWEFNPTPGELTTNQWRWMGGSSAIDPYSGQPGMYGTMGVPATNNMPGGRYGASTWTDSSGNFWLFGGAGFDANGNSGNLNDLWEFNPSVSPVAWAWMGGSSTGSPPAVYGTLGTPAAGNVPGGRAYASSWIDSTGNFWLFGGSGTGASSGGMLNDLWAFNPPTSQWVWMSGSGTPFLPGVYGTLQTPATTNLPGGRNQATSWTDSYGNFWLFGGDGRAESASEVGVLNDLWVYPPPTICWGPPSAIQISPATLPVGFVGESYFENFTATGGCGEGYTWSVTSGTALSAVGLSLTKAGIISGSPNATETAAPFTVQVTDPQGNTGEQDYTLTIYPDILITPATLPAGTVGTLYSQPLTGTGGSGGPYSFSVASGTALSAVGLSLSSAGLISGTPNATENAAPFSVQIADSQGDFTHQNFTLTINAAVSAPAQVTDNETITVTDTETFPDVVDSEPITVTDTVSVTTGPIITGPASLPPGVIGVAYTPTTITASGGTQPYAWSATGLPPGLAINGTGVISGTPTADAGSPYSVKVTVTDSNGLTATASFSLTVTATSPLTITGPASLPTGYLNEPYPNNITITASGGSQPYTWTATGLPPGLSINASSGELSGTPIADAGSPYAVTVKVEDSNGNTATANYSLTVDAALAITTTGPLPTLYVGSMSNLPITFTASGGSGVYLWSAAGLPPGLSLSTGGELTGPPTELGVFAVTVTVTDSAGNTNSVVFSLTVTSPSLQITASPPTLTIPQGQSGYTTLTFNPIGGYSASLTLSCSGLPANSLCSFTLLPNGTPITSPLQVAAPVSVKLTIETDVNAQLARTESAPTPLRPAAILTAIAFWSPFSLLGLIALRRKRKLFTKNRRWFGLCVIVLIIGGLASLAGCVAGAGFGPYVTPVGTSTVTVVVTPSSGSAQTLNIGVTITKQ